MMINNKRGKISYEKSIDLNLTQSDILMNCEFCMWQYSQDVFSKE